jgi:hypothetical protein
VKTPLLGFGQYTDRFRVDYAKMQIERLQRPFSGNVGGCDSGFDGLEHMGPFGRMARRVQRFVAG